MPHRHAGEEVEREQGRHRNDHLLDPLALRMIWGSDADDRYEPAMRRLLKKKYPSDTNHSGELVFGKAHNATR